MGADGKPPVSRRDRWVADALDMDVEDVLAALDEEESSVSNYRMLPSHLLVDIPSIEIRRWKVVYDHTAYSDYIGWDRYSLYGGYTRFFRRFWITVSGNSARASFVYQILYRIAVLYQSDLRINRQPDEFHMKSWQSSRLLWRFWFISEFGMNVKRALEFPFANTARGFAIIIGIMVIICVIILLLLRWKKRILLSCGIAEAGHEMC